MFIMVKYFYGSVVKNPSDKQEMQVRSLGQEDHLEKKMATHFSILAWKIPWTEEPSSLQSMGSQKKSDMTEDTHTHTLNPHTYYSICPHSSFDFILDLNKASLNLLTFQRMELGFL